MTVVILWYINVLFMQHCQVLLNNDFCSTHCKRFSAVVITGRIQ